ncbi:MAG: hypothetical protein EXS35_04240 [Pedosphaera sp.]|nr:hypothetical protein [Pedosphaera sp.]
MSSFFDTLQKVSSNSEDKFERHWFDCRNVAQSVREDLAKLLGLTPGEVKFVREGDLTSPGERPTDSIPEQVNDALDAGEFTPEGWFRLGVAFGVPYNLESDPAWVFIIPLQIARRENTFVLKLEGAGRDFSVGVPPKIDVRPFTEWFLCDLIERRKTSFEKFIAGSSVREAGFAAIMRLRERIAREEAVA